MNERLKNLLRDANQYANNAEITIFRNKSFHEVVEAKFAELIVKECLSVIEEMNPHDPERDIDDIFDKVGTHFGIKE